MVWLQVTLVPWLALGCLALSCRAGDPTRAGAGAGGPRGKARPGSAAPSVASGTGGTTTSPPAVAAAPAPAPARVLPKLKPIRSKPFPEGIDEATVCEAIDSTEPDLWVRFGHIVPPDIEGSIYILETGPESKDKLYRYIRRDYVWGYDSQQASCRGNLTLLYIRKMFEESVVDGKPFGRKHLSQAIERKLGIKTRASFQFTDRDSERLSQYCRADSELCDRLHKLDIANLGQGLCSLAVAKCETRGRGTPEERLLATCRGLPPDMLACLQYSRTAAESIPCADRLVAALCP